ncbi:MAG TPA: hypothetical protein PK972_13900 [Deltaproteobacteria bacterium]|nr:hypothetical protein [Deltaproteobacteria bacterium]
MKVCPKCRAQNLNSKETCDECGAPLSENDAPEKRTPDANGVYYDILNQLIKLNDKIASIETTKRDNGVVVLDVNMSFGSMVLFMVKWAVAVIPALIILFFLGSIFIGLCGGLFSALLRG